VSLTKTAKKTLDHKKALVDSIRDSIDANTYVWLFSVGDMRNDGLQDVRKAWKGTGRIIYGKNKVVAKALGESIETEYKEGLVQLAKVRYISMPRLSTSLTPFSLQRLKGPVGLFLTSWEPKETLEWFNDFSRPAFARMGATATKTITLEAGPVLNFEGEPFPHSMEPQLRSCGLGTKLVKGVPTIEESYVVCKKGEKLSAEKARLLLLLGHMLAVSGFMLRLQGLLLILHRRLSA
jgi:mRNA turnover protein 4